MKFFKKHLAFSLILIAILAFSLCKLSLQPKEWNIDTETIEGSSLVLSDLKISTVSLDQYILVRNNLYFGKDGERTKEESETEFLKDINEHSKNLGIYDNYLSIEKDNYYTEDFRYYIQVYGDQIRFYRDSVKNNKRRAAYIELDRSGTLDTPLWLFSEVMTVYNDRLYFLAASNGNQIGEGGIYRIDKFNENAYVEAAKNDTYRRIFPIDIKKDVSYFSLSNYDSQFYVTYLEDELIHIKCVDIKKEEELYELTIPFNEEIYSYDLQISKEQLIAVVNNDYISVFNKKTLNNELDLFKLKSDSQKEDVRYYFKEDILYVAYVKYDFNDETVRRYGNVRAKTNAYIEAYDKKAQILYKGIIKTDNEDDFNRYLIFNQLLVNEDKWIPFREIVSVEIGE